MAFVNCRESLFSYLSDLLNYLIKLVTVTVFCYLFLVHIALALKFSSLRDIHEEGDNFFYELSFTGEDPPLTEWEHLPPIGPRSNKGYVGLKNAGATCYMNSVIQQVGLLYFPS